MTQEWEKKAQQSRDKLQNSIPNEWRVPLPEDAVSALDHVARSGLLSETELAITQSLATTLVTKLACGQISSVEVTTAFCKRAALAIQWTNCGHDFFPEEALAQAQQLDEYYAEHGRPVGPLHGLPISLKDQLRIKGHETHMGYVSWIGKVDEEDSVLTALLRKAGAVFYVKTSVPQTLMLCETINNIVGKTVNPRNKALSCGGSSGGEGAMVGFRGGIIGVGTDIGGSIRVPSAFNFLYGIRPSHGRMPYAGMANSMEGQETVHSVVGPLAHSAADIRLFLTSVLNEKPWEYDSKVIPMPWRPSEEDVIRQKVRTGSLNLAYYKNDGVVTPHPPILRAINTVVTSLKLAGHGVSEWKPHKHDYAGDLINGIYVSDGCVDVFKDINASGEPSIPNIKNLLNPDLPKADMNQLWDVHLQKWTYQREYLQKWLEFEKKHGVELDAIIAPITPCASIRHDQFKYYGYATTINLLDLTSVVVPVTFVDKSKDIKATDFRGISEMDSSMQEEYDPEVYHGAPVAVQIIGRRLSEERTLAIAEEIGRLLGDSCLAQRDGQ